MLIQTSGAVPGRDAPLRVIYSSLPTLCCLGWVKTTPAERIATGEGLRWCCREQDVAEGPRGRKAVRSCPCWQTRRSVVPGMESRAARATGAGSVPLALRGAGQSRARRTLSLSLPGSLWMTSSTW